MQFLKILFWVIGAVVLFAFAHANWRPVTIRLWSDMLMDVKLPLLLLIMMLIGFLPTYVLLRAERWRTKRRLASMERASGLTVEATSADTAPPSTLAATNLE